jgi:O-antigen biosynthesis protein
VRMFSLLTSLRELGNGVTFIGDNLLRMEPYTQELQQRGVEVIFAPYTVSIEDYLVRNGKYFDIVILSRAHIAIQHISNIKKYCPKAKVIFDTVDLQFLRESRRAEVENNEKLRKEVERLKRLEFQLARMSDITLVVSPVEKEIMLKEDPSLRVELISNIHHIHPPQNGFSVRKDLVFLGGFAHPPNVDAMKWFVEEIFPLIMMKMPDVKLYIVGDEPPAEILRLKSVNVIVTGYVEDLTPYFENCRLFVSPLRYGAGVKGKIGQSMSYGLPVVTTSIGAEGMGLVEGVDILIADKPEAFAKKVLMIYRDEVLWKTISKNSIHKIEMNYTPEVTQIRLKNILESLSSKM